MTLHVSFSTRRNLSGQIYAQIRDGILAGRLRPGDPLPPTRELADDLSVARNTVSVAYDRLAGEGFLTTRVGAGTFVSDELGRGTPERVGRGPGPLRPRAVWAGIPEAPDLSAYDPRFDFRPGLPDARLFPYATWRRLMSDELRPAAVGNGGNSAAAGHAGLRSAIARHIGVSRGVEATASDIVITNGIQQALDVISRTLLAPGARVAMEQPGYSMARHLFVSLGARVTGVPVDAEGLVVDAIPDDTELVYVSPSHQFPLGVAMSLRRRLDLLAWAQRHGAALVEDDYDSEFRFAGRPIEPLHSLDRHGRVLYLGSFSKVMLPTLRLGFVVAPPSLHRALSMAKTVTDWHTTVPTQAALARFIDSGALARHLRRMRSVYSARFELVRQILTRDFGDHLAVLPSVAGLHVGAPAPSLTDDQTRVVVARARAMDVAVLPIAQLLPPAARADGPHGFVIGYGAIPTDRIEEGLRRFRTCFTDQEPDGGELAAVVASRDATSA